MGAIPFARLGASVGVLLVAVPACGLGLAGTGPEDGGLPERVEIDAGPATTDAGVDAADAGPTTAVGACAVSALSMNADYARAGDGAIKPDGQKDGVFEISVTGPAIALAVVVTDATGKPNAGQQWDTWVGKDAVPAAVANGFTQGSSTFQLAVLENGKVLNDAAGRLTLAAGPHALWVAGSSVGSFVKGTTFVVLAQAPDGTLVRGPLVTY